jgi:16S rRNA (uracil1498-N3)-methyltransferase
MADRYFSAEPIEESGAVTLAGSEAHHLLHVMRAKPGLEVVLFDGRGGEYRARVSRCDRSTVEFAVGEKLDVERELACTITLAVALPKGDRQRWLIEKAVELGVSRLVPLSTERSVGDGLSAKHERQVIETSKQCGRNRLMELREPVDWAAFITEAALGRRIVAHPGGQPLVNLDVRLAGDLTIAVGPEGGFTEDEITLAVEAGWERVDLGSRILRIETAAVALASAVTLG